MTRCDPAADVAGYPRLTCADEEGACMAVEKVSPKIFSPDVN